MAGFYVKLIQIEKLIALHSAYRTKKSLCYWFHNNIQDIENIKDLDEAKTWCCLMLATAL